jgi:hypothetical protein
MPVNRMSRLKRLIQTVHIWARSQGMDSCAAFKQKGNFDAETASLLRRTSLYRQAFRQKASIICERPFAKKSGISLRGKLCCATGMKERITGNWQCHDFYFLSNAG